jgi:uncharacterized protein YbcI
VEAQPKREYLIENRGQLLSALTRELIALHKRYYGRGATKSRAIFAHRNLLLVELEDGFLTVEQTMLERGADDLVREARSTFQGIMRDEFVSTVEKLTGRTVESYESVPFLGPNRIVELFYLEPDGGRRTSPGSVTMNEAGQVTEETEITAGEDELTEDHAPDE